MNEEDITQEEVAAAAPVVNYLYFEHCFVYLGQWFGMGCCMGEWKEARRCLDPVADYLMEDDAAAPIRPQMQTMREQSRLETPDVATLRKAWEELVAFLKV